MEAVFAGMGRVAANYFRYRCFVCRLPADQTTQRDAYGRTPNANALFKATTTQAIKCQVNPASGGERSEAGTLTAVSDHVVLLEAGTDVTEKDRLRVLAAGAIPEREFEIVQVNFLENAAVACAVKELG